MIDNNGKREDGEDNGAISRDALSEFWGTFYIKYTTGEGSLVVPVLVDTMKEKWEDIAKIIAIGYIQEGYFLIHH